MIIIYALIDPRNDEIRYIGKARKLQRRIQNHLCPASLAKRTHKAAWLRMLRSLDLMPEVVVLEIVENDCWQESERTWIAYYRNLGSDLTNYTDGGEGGHTGRTNYKWTDEQRKKFRLSRLGKSVASPSAETLLKRGQAIKKAWNRRRENGTDKGIWNHSDEAKRQLSIKHSGKVLSSEHREKLSKAHSGKTLSEQHKMNIRIGHLNKFNGKEI